MGHVGAGSAGPGSGIATAGDDWRVARAGVAVMGAGVPVGRGEDMGCGSGDGDRGAGDLGDGSLGDCRVVA
jgi:hypothetical protein